MIKPGKDLATRLNQTFSLIFNNFKFFIIPNIILQLLNIIIVLIGTFLFGLFIIIFLFTGEKLGILIGIGLGLAIFLFALRIPSATTFLLNFKLSKDISTNNKQGSMSYISYAFNKLTKKMIIDFRYLIVFGLPTIVFGLTAAILYIISKSLTIVIILSIIWFIYMIYLSVKYFFAPYYCFEYEKFTFQDFKKSTELTKGKYWQIIGNIILVGIIIWIVSLIISFLVEFIFSLLGVSILSPFSILSNYKLGGDITQLLIYIKSFSIVSGIILYFIAKLISNIIPDVLKILYFYIYFKHLDSLNKQDNTKK